MMITNEDPTKAGNFPPPAPETIAGFDDDQLERAADRAPWERARRVQRFAQARLSAVLTGVGAFVAVVAALGVFPSITGNSALTIVTVFLVLVFAGSVVVAIVERNEVIAWNNAENRIATEIHRRRLGP